MATETIGPYELDELLAEGEAAQVWRARRGDGGLQVVLKRVLPRWAARSGVREAFLDAVKDARTLHHEHLVQMLDFGERPEGLYAVFEAIDGPQLSHAMGADEGLDADGIRRLMAGILRGLAYVHRCVNPFTGQPLVHGDVSPTNVLIDPDGAPRITDIGFARLVHEGGLPGKPAPLLPRYCAPEVGAAGMGLSPASDVYGAGRILEDLLLRGPGRPDVVLADVVRQATAEDPAQRPADAQQLLQRLTAAVPPVLPITAPTLTAAPPQIEVPPVAGEFLRRRYRPMGLLTRSSDTFLYKVRDRSLDQVVALKLRLLALDDSDEGLDRFEREMQRARAIQHPNVAKVHHLEAGPGFAFYTMEFAQGRLLRERLADGAMPVDECLVVFRQLAAALAAVHEAGLVHRDLRSDSIALTHGGRTVLFDFGLMREEGAELAVEAPGEWSGMPRYTAPEQDSGWPANHLADLFSFGALLHEALTGRPAFDAPTQIAVFMQKQEDPARLAEALPAEVPAGLRQLIESLLQRDPDARPATASEVLARIG